MKMCQWAREFVVQKETISALIFQVETILLVIITTGSYPEPDSPSPHSHILFLMHFNIILPPTLRSSKWSLKICQLKFCISYLSNVCYMTHPFHPPWFGLSNDPKIVLHLNTRASPHLGSVLLQWMLQWESLQSVEQFGYKQSLKFLIPSPCWDGSGGCPVL
jgi:hypothetical protein